MSQNLFSQLRSKNSSLTKSFLVIQDFLSLKNPDDIILGENLENLGLRQDDLGRSLKSLLAHNLIIEIKIQECSECKIQYNAKNENCPECGACAPVAYDGSVYRVLEKVPRTDDFEWIKYGFQGGSEVLIRSHDSILKTVLGFKDGDEIRLQESLSEFSAFEYFEIDGRKYRPKSKQQFMPQFGPNQRHYSYDISEKIEVTVQKQTFTINGSIIGSNNNFNQISGANHTVNDTTADEVKKLFDILSSNQDLMSNEESAKKITEVKNMDTKSLVQNAKEIVTFLNAAGSVFLVHTPNVVEKISKFLAPITT